jgi:hypothetical protein
MPDLERELRALRAEVDWPPTPDLAGAVVARLPERPARAPRHRRAGLRPRLPRRRLALALAAALLLIPSAAMALPGPRHAILDALGLRHVAVERRPRVPAAHDPRLGDRTTLAGAARAAGATPLLPAALGRPDRVYVVGQIVTVLYDREHLLLAQAGGRLHTDILEKVISVDDRIRRVRVAGRPGVWLPGRHAYQWTDQTGGLVRSGSALVWERAGRVLRLEGSRSLRDALRIAASVR